MWRELSRWAALLALACCALLPPPVQAQAGGPTPLRLGTGAGEVPLAGMARYWRDETGSASVDDVEAGAASLPWQVLRPGQLHRLDHHALWLQFDAASPPPEHWFLQVGSAGIDSVQLFYRDAEGKWVAQSAGVRHPVTAWPVPGRVPTFVLAEDARVVRYWLRVQHSRVDFAAPLALVSAPRLIPGREREQLLLGAYAGLALLIALASLANGVAYGDRAFLSYALYVALLGSGQLARLGIAAQHLTPDWPGWNETSSDLLPGLSTAAALWFVRVVTDPARFSRALDLTVVGLVAATLGATALDAVQASRASLALVLVCTVLAVTALVACVGWAWIDGRDPDVRLVALGFLPVLVFALFPIARGLSLIPASGLTRYGLFLGALLEMPILYYALRVRSTRRRESEVRARALSRTDALTGLAHRRGLLQRLESSLTRARAHPQSFALLGVRVANMEALVAEFGPETAEKALVVAASHVRRAITEVDCAARVGDQEFALLLESPVAPALAMSRAQQVVASGLRQTDALPAAVTLKFHVAVAMLPQNALDGAAVLDWVLDGLKQMPPDSRKLIRPLNF